MSSISGPLVHLQTISGTRTDVGSETRASEAAFFYAYGDVFGQHAHVIVAASASLSFVGALLLCVACLVQRARSSPKSDRRRMLWLLANLSAADVLFATSFLLAMTFRESRHMCIVTATINEASSMVVSLLTCRRRASNAGFPVCC
jgi:hypothetical protein